MSNTVSGEIETLAQNGDNYGIKISDTWYNLSKFADNDLKDKQRELSKGQKVELELDQEGAEYYEDITVVAASEADGSREGDATDQDSSVGASSHAPLTKKEVGMRVGAAGNQAATVIAHSDLNPVEDQGKILEMYGELVNGFYNAMRSQAEDKVGDQ